MCWITFQNCSSYFDPGLQNRHCKGNPITGQKKWICLLRNLLNWNNFMIFILFSGLPCRAARKTSFLTFLSKQRSKKKDKKKKVEKFEEIKWQWKVPGVAALLFLNQFKDIAQIHHFQIPTLFLAWAGDILKEDEIISLIWNPRIHKGTNHQDF